jgi:hypothetical protein
MTRRLRKPFCRSARIADGWQRRQIVRRVKAELAKSGITDATVAKAEARERAEKIAALEKQARDWRQKALNEWLSRESA